MKNIDFEINELINTLYIIKKNNIKEDSETLNILRHSSIHDNIDLIFKEVYSTRIFPRIITYENIDVLIWDMCYWYVFEKFLTHYFIINISISKSDKISRDISMNQLLNSLNYFLAVSYLKREPNLSFNFATRYYIYNTSLNKTNKISKEIYSKELKNIIREYILILKIYSFLHEKRHQIYKNNTSNLKKDLINCEKSLNEYIDLYDNSFNRHKIGGNVISKNSLIELIRMNENNLQLKEEMLCDWYAINDCLKLFFSINRNNYSLEKTLSKCIEAFNINNFFCSTIIGIGKYWDNYINYFNKKIDISKVLSLSKENKSSLILRMMLKENIAECSFYSQYPKEFKKINDHLFLKEIHESFIGYNIEYFMSSNEAKERFFYNYNSAKEHNNAEEIISSIKFFLEWENQ